MPVERSTRRYCSPACLQAAYRERIAVTNAAFNAIRRTMPFSGSVAFEPEVGVGCERHLWLKPHMIAKLKHLRGPTESYSHVILRLAAESERASGDQAMPRVTAA
jgi:hypothetical protein